MQSTKFYLDTARLGQMSRRAQATQIDFARMASNEGASPLFEHFLREGSDSWTETVRSRYPYLGYWRGIGHLKQGLRKLAGSDENLPVLMVNRSAQLMQLAARLLFQRCRNVLVTDLDWQPYRSILEAEARRSKRKLTAVAVRNLLCETGLDESNAVDVVTAHALRAGCDGLFLTSVSHHGVRLPVARLVGAIEGRREMRSVVVDGSQDFCHASAGLCTEFCDLFLAGCHKWMRGFHPLGLGFYGRRRSQGVIDTLVESLQTGGLLDDPLLRLTQQMERAVFDGESETVNLIPLFTCQGAVIDALEVQSPLSTVLSHRQGNLAVAAEIGESTGWHAIVPARPFRTGILILQAAQDATRRRSPQELRAAFAQNGVALTAYENGVIRLSMSSARWNAGDARELADALRAVA